MNKFRIIFAALLFVSTVMPVLAEEQEQQQKQADYRHTLRLSGSFLVTTTQTESNGQYSEAEDRFLLGLNVEYDYWVTDNITIGVKGATQATWDDISESGYSDILVTAKYHFVNDSLVTPYLGIQGGATYKTWTLSGPWGAETDESWGGSIGGMVGVNIFFSEARDTSFYVEYSFLYTETDGSSYTDSITSEWRHSINWGIGFYF